MTYGDLTSREICIKLSMVSFSSPQKNLEVYKFVYALRPLQEFFEVERSKLLQKYGTDDGNGLFTIYGEAINDFQKDFKAICDIEIQDTIPPLNLTEEDFSEKNCTYPPDKNLWMNANDIDAVLKISKK